MVIERDGVVLDLDGVLVDSTVCVERHHREWAPRHGLDERKVIRTAHGRRGVADIVGRGNAAEGGASQTRALNALNET